MTLEGLYANQGSYAPGAIVTSDMGNDIASLVREFRSKMRRNWRDSHAATDCERLALRRENNGYRRKPLGTQ